MEKFVAVKPILDYQIGTLKQLFAPGLGVEGSTSTKPANIVIDYNENSDQFIADLIYSLLLVLLKRYALLFDKIYILDSKEFGDPSEKIMTELEWLANENIVNFVSRKNIVNDIESRPEAKAFLLSTSGLAVPNDKTTSKKQDRLMSSLLDELRVIERDTAEKTKEQVNEEMKKVHKILEEADKIIVKYEYPVTEIFTRLHALNLEHFEKIIATPLLSYKSYLKKLQKSNRSDVAQVVIHDLPVPAINTPWEKIIEFRENNQKNLLNLRRWIRKLSVENLSAVECKQELDWLKHEFQSHLKLHKIKANAATFEAIVKAPLEILENLVTLKFSKIPDPLFAINKRKISLMEAELNAPGREIAYLIKSKQSFE